MIILLLSSGGSSLLAQCTTATYGQYPTSTYSPTCNGSPSNITTLAYAGEYSVVSVVSGTAYTFSSSVGSDYLTITNDSGTPQAFGTTPVMWTATFTGTVRFYTHTNSSCGESSDFRTRAVSCGGAPPAAGCTTATYGLYPSSTYSPNCTGSPGTITTAGYAGEYSNVSVVSGTTYTFSSSVSTDFITIANSTPTVQAYGTTPVMWTATFTGTARFYTHTNSSCGESNTSRSRIVTCSGAAPLDGENCSNAQNLASLTSPYSSTTSGYADDFSSSCLGSGAPDRIFYIDVPNNNTLVIGQTVNAYDSKVRIAYGGSCPGTSEITCYDDSDIQNTTWQNTTGSTQRVYFTLDGFSGGAGTFTLAWSLSAPPVGPVNDLCSNALPIACGATVNGTTAGATFDDAGTCGVSNTAPGVWYYFTSPTSGSTTVSLCGSSYDTKISVFSGSCGSLVCVGGNDDFCSLQSQLSFSATAGTTYYVLVHGFGSSNGAFSLNLSCPTDPCANDTQAPTISCPGSITPAVLDPNNCTNALPDYRPYASASDNCDLNLALTQSPVPGTIITGVQTVTVSVIATDDAGNSNSCTYMVPHVDVTAPTAVCRTGAVILPPSGTYTLGNADVLNLAMTHDNCGGITVLSISPSTVDVNDVGNTIPVVVSIRDASGNTAGCTANITVNVGQALPEPWVCDGINNGSTACSYNPVDETFTIQTGGANNSLGTDNLGSINLGLCGDFEITVKVESITPNGYAGLMARESDAVGSKMVGLYTNFTNMVRWESRSVTNGNKAVNFYSKPLPYWLRLVRQGNWFFGYYSYNGASFALVTAQMVPMNSCLDLGMAAFTNIPGAMATAVFSNVGIAAQVPTIVELPVTDVEQANVSRNISLFPNPAQDVITLSFSELQFGEEAYSSEKVGGTVLVRLRNELGQLIETRQLDEAAERFEWNVSNLNPGLYFIEVQSEGQAPQTLRFVKAK
ncbi:MAG: HYR domain-containing protein [Phaeodactylibacter sp.]|nr:HYR domain-containing protein [Phaeodactylibacter sp.]